MHVQGHGHDFNPLIATLKPQSNGPSYSNTMISTLAVDRWVVTCGTARRGLASPCCTKCNSPPINGQYTNFVLFSVALSLPLEFKGLSVGTKPKGKGAEAQSKV